MKKCRSLCSQASLGEFPAESWLFGQIQVDSQSGPGQPWSSISFLSGDPGLLEKALARKVLRASW